MNPENTKTETDPKTEGLEVGKIIEAEKIPEPSKERDFELVDLKEAQDKKYPWEKDAESARKFLKKEISAAEKGLGVIKDGVKENTPLYKTIKKKAEAIFGQRQLKNETGTPESDFLSAIGEVKKNNEFKLGILNSRWQRLEVLSSDSKGANDPELNERAYNKAEELQKRNEQADDLKCNDEARRELLLGLKKKIPEKEIEQQRAEKEKTTILKNEMVESFDKTLDQVKENPTTGKVEIADKEQLDLSYKRAQGFFKELTGEELNSRAKEEARLEVEREGKKIMKKEEFFSEARKNKAEEQEQFQRWGKGIRLSWEGLSEEERREAGNIKQYAKQLEAQRKLLAEKKGIDIPQDVYYDLLKQGLKPQELRLKGWFKKKVYIPVTEGMLPEAQFGKKPLVVKTLEEFRQENNARQESIKREIKETARVKLEKKYLEGRDNLLRRRIKKTEELVSMVAELDDYKKALEQRKEEHEKGASTQKKAEVLENVDWAGEERKIKERFDKRMDEIRRILDEASLLLGLTPKEKIPDEIQEDASAKREQIKTEYDSAADLLKKRRRVFEQQKRARITKEIKEKLAAA